jgi:hypothetical protein
VCLLKKAHPSVTARPHPFPEAVAIHARGLRWPVQGSHREELGPLPTDLRRIGTPPVSEEASFLLRAPRPSDQPTTKPDDLLAHPPMCWLSNALLHTSGRDCAHRAPPQPKP